MPSLEAQNGRHSIVLANESQDIVLRCAFNRNHPGGSRGHCCGWVRNAYHTHRAQRSHADQPSERPCRFSKMVGRFCVTYPCPEPLASMEGTKRVPRCRGELSIVDVAPQLTAAVSKRWTGRGVRDCALMEGLVIRHCGTGSCNDSGFHIGSTAINTHRPYRRRYYPHRPRQHPQRGCPT
jgi:hypothetical protein